MKVEYAYYAITDPGYPEAYTREHITSLDKEIDPNDVPGMIRDLKGSSCSYDYVLIEKQLVRNE